MEHVTGHTAEQQVVDALASAWVSLGLEYATGAPDVTAIYAYGASEDGSTFVETLFEQNGTITHPSRLRGVDASDARVDRLHELMFEDLRAARARFAELGVPAPTEYRIRYDCAAGRLQVDISRESRFGPDSDRLMEEGIADWLGGRAPRLL